MPNDKGRARSSRLGARRASLPAFIIAALVTACAAQPRDPVRLYTDDLAIGISFDPQPPRALDDVRFRVTVRDRETGQPIENGQGRIFATNEDRHSIDNGLTPGAEVGTYYTTLRFVNAGPWAMGVQFRRDSTQRLQRTNDWMQDVLPDTSSP
ncbi:MAG TPA: hypothetical protein VJ717_04500 [Gemmatimonadaceae bacterium]|nr:hypothetical protein [Gemmatimonadaceae bacterium]